MQTIIPLARSPISPSPPTPSLTFTADTGAVGTKYYHLMNTSLLVACPLALMISPSAWTFPIDLFLGVALPLHGHVGFNYVITDYVPKASGKTHLRSVLQWTNGLLKGGRQADRLDG